jgi:hypothetical protein
MTFVDDASDATPQVISNLVGWLLIDHNHRSIIGIDTTTESITFLDSLLLIDDVKLLPFFRLCLGPLKDGIFLL